MSTASNYKSTIGEQSFLAFVVQVLNLPHGVRQRRDWAFPDQVDAIRGKQAINTQLRMEPRLHQANQFLAGNVIQYMCPHTHMERERVYCGSRLHGG
jgi:hypothetical protein